MEYRDNEFPLHVFPETLQSIILDRNKVLSWDINTFATCFLSASASIIGRNGLINNEEYDSLVPPILWVAIIGETGTGKSPMLSLAFKYLTLKHGQSINLTQPRIEEWDSKKPKEREGPRPRPVIYVLSDFTPETVVIDHKTNERGLVILKDELSGFILGMDQYKAGGKGQIEKTLEWFNGGAIESTRTGNVSYLADSCVNIVGGIQPSKMKLIVNDDANADGFSMRFLFVELPVVPLYKTKTKPNKKLTENMLSLFKKVDIYQRTVFTISPEADEIQFNYSNDQIRENWQDATKRGVNSKLNGYYLFRFCIIIELLEQADKGKKGSVISAETMNKAIELVEFFRTENLRQYKKSKTDSIADKHPLAKDLDALNIYKMLELNKEYSTSELAEIFRGVWKEDTLNKRKLTKSELFTKVRHGFYLKAYDDGQ